MGAPLTTRLFPEAQRRGTLLANGLLAALVVTIVGMMLVPLPTVLLDVLIATNLTLGVLMLVVAIYIPDGLAFGAMPTVLLITTLYRLALNVSTTRLILLQADAGEMVRAFGQFVVQGNYAVGAVIFLILILVQYVVVAKGAERVAEVGARFTLDAMPGKQLAIDAEVRQGALGQEQARQARHALQRESQFYGAMDGAMKFVKGDAIAGILITAINLVAGVVVGVAMRGLDASTSLRHYGLLTIGDGLVSQIPSLLVSTAAGMVVTRVASEQATGSLGADVGAQLFGRPRVLAIVAGFLVLLALVPGLPAFPFLMLAALQAALAYRTWPADDPMQREQDFDRDPGADAAEGIRLELGAALAQTDLPRRLQLESVPGVRSRLLEELGVPLPPVRVLTLRQGGAHAFRLSLAGIEVCCASLAEGRSWVVAPPAKLAELGIEPEPVCPGARHLQLHSVPMTATTALSRAGYAPLSPSEVIEQLLLEAARRHAVDLIGIQEVRDMLDRLERSHPALVRAVTPQPVSLAQLTELLRALLAEGVCILPLREILEALAGLPAEPGHKARFDLDTMLQRARTRLSRRIVQHHAVEGQLCVHQLDPEIEDVLREGLGHGSRAGLALSPDEARDIVQAVQRACSANDEQHRVVLLTQADVRRPLQHLLSPELPGVVVLSYQELAADIRLRTLDPVRV